MRGSATTLQAINVFQQQRPGDLHIAVERNPGSGDPPLFMFLEMEGSYGGDLEVLLMTMCAGA